MNKKERSHEDSRRIHCAACGKKDKKCFPVTDSIADILKEEVYQCYDANDASLPAGICGDCRKNLFRAKRGSVVPSAVRDRWSSMDFTKFRQPVRAGVCSSSCPLCKSSRFSFEKTENETQPDLPRIADDGTDEKEAEACFFFLHSMGKMNVRYKQLGWILASDVMNIHIEILGKNFRFLFSPTLIHP